MVAISLGANGLLWLILRFLLGAKVLAANCLLQLT